MLMHPYTNTQANLAQIMVTWGQHGQCCEIRWWHNNIVEDVDHRWLLPTSILDVWKPIQSSFICCVDRHMGAPLHSYTGKVVGPDFGKLGSMWGYEMMARWHCWGSKPPLTVSHIHIWIIKSVLSTSMFLCCGWAYGCTLTLLYLCRVAAKFWNIGVRQILNDVVVSWVRL